jgi:hypothetical protein
LSGRTETTWTREKAQDALDKANQVRRLRREWKDAQRGRTKDEGLEALIALVRENPPWAHTWSLVDVLRSCPKIGAAGVRYAIHGFGIGFSHQTRIGWLNDRQRDVVIEWAQRKKKGYLANASRR